MAALSADSDNFDLLVRLKQGDEAAWTRVVFDEQARIYGLAFRLVGPNDAKDVTQEVFQKAFVKIAQFDGRSTFSTWLYRIAVNQCHLTRRDRQRRAAKMEEFAKMTPPSDTGPTDDDPLDKWKLVRAAFDQLDEDSRLILSLKYFEGLTYKQIGEALGWSSKGTVAEKVRKAMGRLRELLSQRSRGGC